MDICEKLTEREKRVITTVICDLPERHPATLPTVPDFVPLFSVCIPTFNRRELLLSAIDAALGQTYSQVEVVVCDNASDDGTAEAVTAIRDQRVRYHRNPKNIGPSANWAKCLELASGEYFAWLQDDDLLFKDFLADSVRVLNDTNTDCCFGACLYTSHPTSLHNATVFTTALSLDWVNATATVVPLTLALPLAIVESSGIPPAMAFRTEALRAVASEFFDSEFPLYAERLPILHFAQRGKLAALPRVSGVYRAHQAQYSRQMLSDSLVAKRQYRAFLSVLQQMADDAELLLDDLASFLRGAPDDVILRFDSSLVDAPRTLPLVAGVAALVASEIKRRPLGKLKHRAWRKLSRLTPSVIKHLLR